MISAHSVIVKEKEIHKHIYRRFGTNTGSTMIIHSVADSCFSTSINSATLTGFLVFDPQTILDLFRAGNKRFSLTINIQAVFVIAFLVKA